MRLSPRDFPCCYDRDLDDQVLKRQLEAEISSDAHTQFLVDLQQANAMSDITAWRFFADKPLVLADGVSDAKLTVWLRTREGREVRGEPVIAKSESVLALAWIGARPEGTSTRAGTCRALPPQVE